VWLAAGVTDMRCGIDSLAAKVQMALTEDPFSGHVFAFLGRRGDLSNCCGVMADGIVHVDEATREGPLRLAAGRRWERLAEHRAISMLLEGIDWRHPERTWQPRNGGVGRASQIG